MKEKLTNNLPLKLLSLLIAIVIWVVIVNIDDPTKTVLIKDIPITVVNDEALLDNGQCYSIVSDSKVSIKIKGKKSVVDRLKTSDYMAVADLNLISITNAVPVEVSLIPQIDDAPDIINGAENSIVVELDDYVTETYNVQIAKKGTVTSDYYIGEDEITLSTKKVKISGPAQIINTISKVVTDVDVSEITDYKKFVSNIKAYDNNNKVIDSERISFSKDSVNVTVQPLVVKNLNIKAQVEGEVKNGYVYKAIGTDIHSVKIAGDSTSIANASNIVITVDISDLTENNTTEYDLKEFIGNSLKIISETDTVKVTVSIEKLISKTIDFKASNLTFKNLPNDVVINYNQNLSYKVNVRGEEDVLSEVNLDTLKPYIDISKLSFGKQNAIIRFEDAEGVEVLNTLRMPIEMVDKETLTATPTPVPTQLAPTASAAQEAEEQE